MNTLDLINAIHAGDSVNIEKQFEYAMTSRIAERLDDMRMSVAKNMFKENEEFVDITLEDIEEFMQTEEFEQLDELSKKTLAGYVSKNAASQVKLAKKDDELRAASDTLGRLGMSDHIYKAKQEVQGNLDKVRDKQGHRSKGMYKALKRLAKEEFEQLDEISKDALKSYVDKSSKEASEAHGKRDLNKFHKRYTGVHKALKKLTKEE